MKLISPFFWFNDQAEQAASFYVSTFKDVFGDAKLNSVSRYDKNAAAASGQPEGSAFIVEFELRGEPFTAMNGGKPENFDTHFTGAISFVVACKKQEEIDGLWEKLTSGGGRPSQCGWLSDRFGVSWQIVPDGLSEYINGSDPAGASRAMQAMLSMIKFDIAALKRAYDGK